MIEPIKSLPDRESPLRSAPLPRAPAGPSRRSENIDFGSAEDSEDTSLLRGYSKPIAEKHLVFSDDTKDALELPPRSAKARCRPNRSWLSSTICYAMIPAVGAFLLMTAGYLIADLLREPFDKEPPHAEAPPPICQTPECVNAASEILRSLDPNYADIDPCTDFDQYVCGGWRENHDMRPDQGAIFAGTFMQEGSQARLRHLLESSGPSDPADSNIFEKLKDGYNACLDAETVEKRGTEPLEKLLKEFEDIYKLDASSKDSEAGLTDAVQYLVNSGVRTLVIPSVSPDDRDPDNVVVFVTPPRKIGLPAREYYNNTQVVRDYTTVVEKVLGSFVTGKDKSQLTRDVVAFESRLADVTPTTQEQEDVTQFYNPRSIEETKSLLPQISLSDIIAALGPADYETDRLIIGSPSYMESLSKILKETPRETIQLFFKWKIIQRYADNIESADIEPLHEFNNVLAGKDPQAKKERWRKCIATLDTDLGWILSRFYVLNAFSEESKKLGDQIVSDIKERFIFTLGQTSWMSPEVRKLGIQKVGNIVQKIGYPTKSPDVMDPADVEKYYQDLPISNDSFFENAVAVARFVNHNNWLKLGKPTDRNEWEMTVPTVNAYYNPPGNEIVFPAGIMQPPVFHGPDAPLYLSYGAFGAVSGHELSHAFDSTGRHYDETGNYTDWWDEKTVKDFEKRVQCFVDQYSEFTVHGKDSELHVNGRLTLGENIADAGGLTAAYHSWVKRDEAKSDLHLPGLSEFSKAQLFFISYANWWCSKSTPEAAEEAIYNDPHAPKPARIIVSSPLCGLLLLS
ncbi:M13 family metallopeptidase [Aspergillus undulatus]|uniref:M13 family metallopeptidase n=1 Tax=Aspergillus undulatus TaxID=1810928 RepID=UPI003CCCFE6B